MLKMTCIAWSNTTLQLAINKMDHKCPPKNAKLTLYQQLINLIVWSMKYFGTCMYISKKTEFSMVHFTLYNLSIMARYHGGVYDLVPIM